MVKQNTKQIGQSPKQKPVTQMDTLHDTWTVMKPFVRFSVKALKLIGHALIFIVKQIPKPGEHKPNGKSEKVIKI